MQHWPRKKSEATMLRPFNAVFIFGMNVLQQISLLLGLLLIVLKWFDIGPLGNWPWWLVLAPWWAWFALQPIYTLFLDNFVNRSDFHSGEGTPPTNAVVAGWFIFALAWLAMPYAIYLII